jgi:serine/threonine protein phosphatase PrpC
MEYLKGKSKVLARPITPSKPGASRSKIVKSPYRVPSGGKIVPRHRVSNSYGGLMSSERSHGQLKESLSKPMLKSYTDTRSKEVKSVASHRKSSSIIERPSSIPLTDPEFTHKRKYSLERVKIEVVSSFSHKTMTGYMPGNPAKVNQDSYMTILNLTDECSFFGVADGHGINGKDVSSFIKERYPILLSKDSNLLANPRKTLLQCANKMNIDLCHQDFDVNFSGSTFVSVLIRGKKLWCANIGDSRAFIARQLPDNHQSYKNIRSKPTGNHWMSIALSRDHKPNESDESARIVKHGGRVEAYQDEHGNPFGPARVWLKNQNIPGLAMSRSLGDRVAASVGVISEPEILEFDLTSDDKFIVIGSDGIFEFLSNEDVLKIVVPYWRTNDVHGASENLAKEAKYKWMKVRFT